MGAVGYMSGIVPLAMATKTEKGMIEPLYVEAGLLLMLALLKVWQAM